MSEYCHPDGRPMVAPYSLVTGHVIDLAEPDFSHLSVDALLYAISTGLHNTSRYGGQVTEHYSVAAHCILGADLVDLQCDESGFVFFPDLPDPLRQRVKLHFLLHDASEGLGLGDVVYPLKQLLNPIYGPLEDLMMTAVYRRLGLEMEFWALVFVKELDTHMLHDEQSGLRSVHAPYGHRRRYTRNDLRRIDLEPKLGRTWVHEFRNALQQAPSALPLNLHHMESL